MQNLSQKFYSVPATGFMRLPAVLAVIPVCKSTWWAGVKSGRFPTAVKIGERTTCWRAEDSRAAVLGDKVVLAVLAFLAAMAFALLGGSGTEKGMNSVDEVVLALIGVGLVIYLNIFLIREGLKIRNGDW